MNVEFKFLCNAFSLQMIDITVKAVVSIEPINIDGIDLTSIPSAIGHQDTANVLGVKMERINVSLVKGDSILVAQILGGRLPEGTMVLPEGIKIVFLKVTIL